MVKIEAMTIAGLRGVKEPMTLRFGGKSAIVYGDNGSGKSSLADALEWYYSDKIERLSCQEIGNNGIDALRNVRIDKNERAFMTLAMTDKSLDAEKEITYKKEKLSAKFSNAAPEFQEYIKASQGENFIVRHDKLTKFVLDTKTDKLKSLSEIIGFSSVTAVRDTLKKAVNELGREVKGKGYENQIAQFQCSLLEYLGRNVPDDEKFIEAVREQLAPFGLGDAVKSVGDAPAALASLQASGDGKAIAALTALEKIKSVAAGIDGKIDLLAADYQSYASQFAQLLADTGNIAKLALLGLLETGAGVLQGGSYADPKCPLCLQDKNLNDLLNELQGRIASLSELQSKLSKLEASRTKAKQSAASLRQTVAGLLSDAVFKGEGEEKIFSELKKRLEDWAAGINPFEAEAGKAVIDGAAPDASLALDKKALVEISGQCDERIQAIRAAEAGNARTAVHTNLSMAVKAYEQLTAMKKERDVIVEQQAALSKIYDAFVQRQKEGLEAFLAGFSNAINEYYEYMNPGEPIKDLRIVPMTDDDELKGLAIEYQFNGQVLGAPLRCFSESHLNCFGLAFFLASVRAFNPRNGFIVLDDVISSFDSNHRTRFANLLIDKMKDYQIIALTHEKQWFEYFSKAVKGNPHWTVKNIYWDDNRGTYADEAHEDKRAKIETLLAAGKLEGLGNEMRVYLEQFLKEIAERLEVPVKFMFNDRNEDRMAPELLDALKARVHKKSRDGFEIAYGDLFNSLQRSNFIGNKGSHDSSYVPTRGDLNGLWDEIKRLENALYCSGCKQSIATRYASETEKKISCRCGTLSYAWK